MALELMEPGKFCSQRFTSILGLLAFVANSILNSLGWPESGPDSVSMV